MIVTSASGSRTASPVMVGREHELAVLADLGHRLTTGAPVVALVGGRAGMGKTRLVSEADTAWRAQGCRVLLGRCAPVEGVPYAPLVMALRQGFPSDAPVLRMLKSAQFPSRTGLFESLADALDGLAARAPLILVVEDLQWSERAARDALTYLVSQSGGGQWALVGTYRFGSPVTASKLDRFTDALAHRGPIIRLALEPFTAAQVGALASAITGFRTATAEAEALHRRSGGIPLLVEEILAFRGSGVPDHLRNLFTTRVAEQGVAVAEALQVVAVADQCDELVVAAALHAEAHTVAVALKQARDADLVVVESAGYRFRHDLLREVVYDDIPPGRRRELHRLVAGQLAARGDVEPAVLAEHWHQAVEREQAALASSTAAEQAERLHAPATAHGHYERILATWQRLGEDVRQRLGPWDELVRLAAYAAERSGAFARAVDLTTERVAAAKGTAADQALRWERLARYRWEAGDGHGARAAYEQAVRTLPDHAPADVRAMVLSGLAWHLAQSFHFEQARPLAAKALTACAGVDNPAVRWQVHLAQGIAWLGTDTGQEALEEACRLALVVGVGERVAFSRVWLNLSHQRRGQDRERERILQSALQAATSEGLGSSMEAVPRYQLAEYLGEVGRWDEALEELSHNLGRLQVTGVPALFSWGYLSRFAALRGEQTAAEQALDQVRALTTGVPQQPLPLSAALVGRAGWLLWEGRVDDATATAREAVQLELLDPYDLAEPLAVVCRAEADTAEHLRRRGLGTDPAVPPELAARLRPLRRHPAARVCAFVTTSDAELTRLDGQRMAGPWSLAVRAWQDAGDPYQEAYTRWRLAWALVKDRSGRAEASRHLAWARDTAARLGALPLGRAVQRFATQARLPLASAKPPEREAALIAALTARELEVLPLLAAGRSNAEIAELLVISPRTVGVHVSRILHKLGADRRAQVGDIARRGGLLGA